MYDFFREVRRPPASRFRNEPVAEPGDTARVARMLHQGGMDEIFPTCRVFVPLLALVLSHLLFEIDRVLRVSHELRQISSALMVLKKLSGGVEAPMFVKRQWAATLAGRVR